MKKKEEKIKEIKKEKEKEYSLFVVNTSYRHWLFVQRLVKLVHWQGREIEVN